jgi:hypothetical protein
MRAALAALLVLGAVAPRLDAAPAVRYRARSPLLRLLNGGTAPEILHVRLPPAPGARLSPIAPTPPRTRFRRWVYERRGLLGSVRRAILEGDAAPLELDGAGFVRQLKKGVVYNLTLAGDDLMLAETGPSLFRDAVSRHAVLTDYGPAEVGATLQRFEDDTLELINWSGTYLTPAARLAVTADRLRQALGLERLVTRPVDERGVVAPAKKP